ncbi:MAG: MFS transporter [Oscillospiraceae bacterium]|nr:MFS transporter [Oscillospiraceae bacterium]
MNKKHLNDHKTSFRLFVYVWLMYAVVYMTKNCFSGAMASIVAEGIMTKSQTGLITALFYLAYAPLQIVGGRLADRWRPDMLIIIGLLGAATANLIIYINQNYYLMLVVWTLNACLQFALWPAIFKIVSSQLAHEHRIRGVYYITFASTFGLCLTFILSAVMRRWQDNFLLSAILLFIFAIGFLIIYPRAEKKMVPDDGIPAKPIHGDVEIDENLDTSSKTMFKKCGLYLFVTVTVIRGLIELGLKNIAPTLLMESYDEISPAIGNMLNIIIILSGLVGMFTAKAVYPRRIPDIIKGMRLFTFLMLPMLLFTMLVGKINVVFIIISLSLTIAMAAASGLFAQYYSMRFAKYGKNGEVAGIVNAGAALGIVIQSYGIALVADLWNWTVVMGLLAVLCVIALILIAMIYPKWKKFTREYDI